MMIPMYMNLVYNRFAMKKILFLLLWIIPIFQFQAQAAIEIYANGHEYHSFQAYLEARKPIVKKPVLMKASLDKQQEDFIRAQALKLGVEVDFRNIKTFQVNQKKLSDSSLHKLYVQGVENGMVDALEDFYQSLGQPDIRMSRKISSEQLQEVIQQAVITSQYPKLLISEPGKVRIMALTTQSSDK